MKCTISIDFSCFTILFPYFLLADSSLSPRRMSRRHSVTVRVQRLHETFFSLASMFPKRFCPCKRTYAPWLIKGDERRDWPLNCCQDSKPGASFSNRKKSDNEWQHERVKRMRQTLRCDAVSARAAKGRSASRSCSKEPVMVESAQITSEIARPAFAAACSFRMLRLFTFTANTAVFHWFRLALSNRVHRHFNILICNCNPNQTLFVTDARRLFFDEINTLFLFYSFFITVDFHSDIVLWSLWI